MLPHIISPISYLICIIPIHADLLNGCNVIFPFSCINLKCGVFLGEDCSVDVDGCHNNPCEPPYACTDNTPAEHRSTSVAYRCDNCTAGYRFGKEKKCVGKYSFPPKY